MKKLVLVSTICATFIGLSAFGQGYISFTSGASQVYNGLGAAPVLNVASAIDVSFLWATANDTPAVDALLSSTPTTGYTGTTPGVNGTLESYTVATAWSDILNDVNFQLAENQNAANAVVVGIVNSHGSFNYGNDGLAGSTALTTIWAYEISWNATYTSPSAAALAGSAVGWGNVFSYALVSSTQTGASISGASPFGTFIPSVVPEPSTLALAGLGGLSLLLFRRRK